MKKITYTFAVICFWASSYAAKPSPATIQEAQKLAEIVGVKKQMLIGFTSTMKPAIQRQAKRWKLTSNQTKELQNIYYSWFQNDIDQELVLKKIVEIYAEQFTLQELQGLITFYQSSLGKKALKVLPIITSRSLKLGRIEGQKKASLLKARLQKFFKKVNTANQ